MDNSHCTCSIVNPTDSSAPPKSFTFDGVYHINSTTEQIYNEIAYPLVEVSNQEKRRKTTKC